jgi:hypothetical protein
MHFPSENINLNMDVLSHPLTVEELRSLWLFYSSQDPRDSSASILTVDDLGKLLYSIREQDLMRTNLPLLEPEYITYIMSEYMIRTL